MHESHFFFDAGAVLVAASLLLATNLSRKEYLNSKAADATHGLGSEGEVWAKSTVDLFLKDLARDAAVRAMNDECQLYFGNAVSGAAPPAAPASERQAPVTLGTSTPARPSGSAAPGAVDPGADRF
jgi:hypothetical protein